MTSVHKQCGEEVVWARRPDDRSRYLPPLQVVGEGLMVIDGVGHRGPIYQVHRCDPDKIIEWAQYQRDLAAAKATVGDMPEPVLHAAQTQRQRDNYAERQQVREEQWEVALQVPCRTCERPYGFKCLNMTELRRTGEEVETRWPHDSRFEDGQKAVANNQLTPDDYAEEEVEPEPDPQPIKSYVEREAERQAEREKTYAKQRRKGEVVPCRRCGVRTGQRCVRMDGKGETATPHAERMEDAKEWRAQNLPDCLAWPCKYKQVADSLYCHLHQNFERTEIMKENESGNVPPRLPGGR